MKNQPLWYVRREGKLLGPHPRQVVIDCLLLGRFGWDDPATQDGRQWQALKLYPEILSALEPSARTSAVIAGEPLPVSWHNERVAAARRWADERTGIDRRTGEETAHIEASADGDDRRSLDERRLQRELLQVVIWRRLRRDLAAAYERSGASRLGWMPVVGVAVIALAIAIWQREPSTIAVSLGSRVADCSAPAGPYVNWSGCDHSGARLPDAPLRGARLAGARLAGTDLRRADLVYADLSGSNLTGARLPQALLFGANLTGADLSEAILDGADLRFADLRNARIDRAVLNGAVLGNAIWLDGRRCAVASIGRCDD